MPLTYTSPRELFLQLLEGQTPDAALVDELISKASKEGQWHDFKEQDKSVDEQRTVIRKWVTGFANAEGGTLILGVSEPDEKAGTPRRVTGFKAPGGGPADDWVLRVLQDLAGRLFPPPLAVEVQHAGGPVVFVATNRAPGQILPYKEAGEIRYAIRIGESTVDLPQSVVADLLLGRRAHPVLEVRDFAVVELPVSTPGSAKIRISLLLENTSFVAAKGVEVGTVSFSLFDRDAPKTFFSSTLLQFIEKNRIINSFKEHPQQRLDLMHYKAKESGATIKPFEFATFPELTVAHAPRQGHYLHFAFYVMPEGSMPEFYQVKCRYGVTDGKVHATWESPERLLAKRARIWWAAH